jgi:phosphotransferase system HPr-like phosphotransfer protein
VNPKSIFSLLSGCFKKGEIIRIAADGGDAERVVKELVAFINTLEG